MTQVSIRTPFEFFDPSMPKYFDSCPSIFPLSCTIDSDGRIMRRINLDDDDALDEYITRNPIPDEYAVKIFGGGTRSDGWITGGAGTRVQRVLPDYQKKSFSDKWSGRGGGKGKRIQRAKR
jgi:hypothetical protein